MCGVAALQSSYGLVKEALEQQKTMDSEEEEEEEGHQQCLSTRRLLRSLVVEEVGEAKELLQQWANRAQVLMDPVLVEETEALQGLMAEGPCQEEEQQHQAADHQLQTQLAR